ncbi:hypothetical protein TcasGA2_TC008112 [Tribolium castaneum]|uniref:Uncharacterized protein n=1 Tax=Tribolium castaneum TaxID=7070 RepID=D1ZZV7_TRICA|nr:hypothetical protein TcasGA2_TC008112 [Tribolium castaneum]
MLTPVRRHGGDWCRSTLTHTPNQQSHGWILRRIATFDAVILPSVDVHRQGRRSRRRTRRPRIDPVGLLRSARSSFDSTLRAVLESGFVAKHPLPHKQSIASAVALYQQIALRRDHNAVCFSFVFPVFCDLVTVSFSFFLVWWLFRWNPSRRGSDTECRAFSG